jgi:hypothetical protein
MSKKRATKTFDAVVESRKWREEASRRLDAMDAATRLAYLAGLHAKLSPKRGTLPARANTPAMVREDTQAYGASDNKSTS